MAAGDGGRPRTSGVLGRWRLGERVVGLSGGRVRIRGLRRSGLGRERRGREGELENMAREGKGQAGEAGGQSPTQILEDLNGGH